MPTCRKVSHQFGKSQQFPSCTFTLKNKFLPLISTFLGSVSKRCWSQGSVPLKTMFSRTLQALTVNISWVNTPTSLTDGWYSLEAKDRFHWDLSQLLRRMHPTNVVLVAADSDTQLDRLLETKRHIESPFQSQTPSKTAVIVLCKFVSIPHCFCGTNFGSPGVLIYLHSSGVKLTTHLSALVAWID